MVNTLIVALLPIIFTMLLGYISGKIGSFDNKTSGILSKLVMSYALPLSLFWQLNQMSASAITANAHIAFWLLVIMLGWWIVVYLVSHHAAKGSVVISALRAFSISVPAILFVGPALITQLYPKNSAMAISLGGLMMSCILPLTLVVLATTNEENANKSGWSKLMGAILSAFKTPVVIAELLGFVTALLNIHFPAMLENTFTQLGKASAGVGLFLIGLILYYNKPSFSKAVWINVICKEILVPFSAFVLLSVTGQKTDFINEITLIMAISEIMFPSILAQQYGEGQRELSSSMFVSTILSIFILAAIIILRGITI